MNVFCYINKLSGGGAERVMSVLANGLSRRGHKVTMVTDYRMPDEYPLDDTVKWIALDGVPSGRLGCKIGQLDHITEKQRLMI